MARGGDKGKENVGQGDASGSIPSSDIGWQFATPFPDSRHKMTCKLCGRVVTGGITRLKQHLAHARGQIAPCPNVTRELKQEMMKHLMGKKEKQHDKRKQREEVEEHIRQSQRNDRDDEFEGVVLSSGSNDSDPEMTAARRESMREHHQWEETQRFRAHVGGRYDVGGSSRSRGAGGSSRPMGMDQGHRSASVREASSSGRQWIDPNSPEARLAAMDPVLHRSKSAKQPKFSATLMKNLKKKLGTAVSQFVLYSRSSAQVVKNPFFKPMLDTAIEVGKGVPPPTPYEVTSVYLKNELEYLQKWIQSYRPTWEERGVTIMCDGWTGPTRKHLINFLVYSNRGTIYHKSIDATDVNPKDSDYYLGLMDNVVNDIGEKYVVQIVTDNASAFKLAGKKLMLKRPNLYWTGCAAHCIDLMLSDIGKKRSVEKVLSQAKEITSFIYNSNWVVDFMKRFTDGRELLRPVITRFATNFITLESIVKHKNGLRNMFNSEEWKRSKWGKQKRGKPYDVKKIIVGNDFWSKANDIMKVQEPLVKVLRLVDGDEKPTMGFIYEAMDRAKQAIKRDCRYYVDYWKIIDKRWSFQLHHDLHAAGYFLNPQFQYGGAMSNQRIVMDGLKNVIQKLEPNIDNQIKAINQILMFRDKQNSFGTQLAQRAVLQTNPAEWWIHYGTSTPELQQIAVKVLSQTTSSSNCERNWSTFSLIHTKTRNRLRHKNLNKLVFVYYNMRLKIRHATRSTQNEMADQFNPINLDYIFEEDDPLAPWLQEREQPLLDGQDNSDWLNLSDDEGDATDHPETQHVTSSDSASGNGVGLTPPSGSEQTGSSSHGHDNSSDDSGGGGQNQIVEVETSRGGGGSPYRGEQGIAGFHPTEEIGEVPLAHPGFHVSWGGSKNRRRAHHLAPIHDDSDDDSGIVQRFGDLGVDGHHVGTANYPEPQLLYPPYYPPPLPLQSYYPPPPKAYPQSQPNYNHSLPPPPSEEETLGYGIFGPEMPYGYGYALQQQPENSSGSSNTMGQGQGEGCNFLFGQVYERPYNDDDKDGDYQEPARHSFWW